MEHDSLIDLPTHLLKAEQNKTELRVFTQQLQAAFDHKAREYGFISSLAIRFADDDTSAERDTALFIDLIQNTCGLAKPEELLLTPEDPEFQIRLEIGKLRRELETDAGRSLLVVYYAGHADLVPGTQRLFFVANKSSAKTSRAFFERSFSRLWLPAELFPNTDVLFILDCCYAGAVLDSRSLRQPGGSVHDEAGDRSVEIITAVRKDQGALSALGASISFTASLTSEVSRFKETGRISLRLCQVVQKLRAESSNPQMRKPDSVLVLGLASISIPIHLKPEAGRARRRRQQGDALSTSEYSESWQAVREPPEEGAPAWLAVFMVRISDRDVWTDLPALIAWIENQPKHSGVQLIGTWPTNSHILIMQTPWMVWAQLSGLPSLSLLFETPKSCIQGGRAQPRVALGSLPSRPGLIWGDSRVDE